MTIPEPQTISTYQEITQLKQELYFSAVRYSDGGQWFAGPSADGIEKLKESLNNYYNSNVSKIRIFKVELPVSTDVDDAK